MEDVHRYRAAAPIDYNPHPMTSTETLAPTSAAPEHPEAPANVKLRLSVMMFLQYAIWGAWLPLMFPFFNEHRGFAPQQIGYLAAVGAVGALVAPVLAGQFADRYFNTERFLGVTHIFGAILVFAMAYVTSFGGLMALSFFYALL